MRPAALLVALAACGDCPVEVVPACPDCAGGDAKGGVFGADVTIGAEGLIVAGSIEEVACGDATAIEYLEGVGAELGLATIPEHELDAGVGTYPMFAVATIPDGDGGFYVHGTTNDGLLYYHVLFAFDRDGNERWQNVLVDGWYQRRLEIAADGAGGVVAVATEGELLIDGERLPGGLIVVGFDSDGSTRFARVFTSPDPAQPSLGGFGVDAAGQLVVAGVFLTSLDPGDGLPLLVAENRIAFYTIALDAGGATRWALAAQPAESGSVDSLAVAGDGRIFLAGNVYGGSLVVDGTEIPAPSSQVVGGATVVLEFDAGGALRSSFTDGGGAPGLRWLSATDDGAIASTWFAANFGSGSFTFGPATIGGSDSAAALVAEIADGEVRWARVYDGPADQFPSAVAVAPSGAAFLTMTQLGAASVEVNGATFRGEHTLLLELGR